MEATVSVLNLILVAVVAGAVLVGAVFLPTPSLDALLFYDVFYAVERPAQSFPSWHV